MSCFELILLALLFVGAVATFAWFQKGRSSQSSPRKEPMTGERIKYKLVHRSIRADADEPHPEGNGYYVLRVNDNKRLSWETLPPGLLSFAVAGALRHQEALQSDAFAPGSSLSLVPEPDNIYDPNAVNVCSPDLSAQAGYVPRELALKVGRALKRGEVARCISMWEEIEQNRRVALRVLIVSKGVDFST